MNGLAHWLLFYAAYLTWSLSATAGAVMLATLMPRRLDRTSRALRRRPGLAWLMGALQLWVILMLFSVCNGRPLVALLAIACTVLLGIGWGLGLTAVLADLGAAVLATPSPRLAYAVLTGAAVLFLSCAFPLLGQVALVLLSLGCAGAATLGALLQAPVETAHQDLT